MRYSTSILLVFLLGCVQSAETRTATEAIAPDPDPRSDPKKADFRARAGISKSRASVAEIFEDVRRGGCSEDELIGVICSDEYFLQKSVREDVASLGEKVVIPIAWKLFEGPEPDTTGLSRAMGILQGNGGIPYKADEGRMARRLTSLLDHDDPKIRECAVRLFPYLKDSTPLPKLVSMLGDPDDFVRRQVVDSLGLTGGRAEREAIREWLPIISGDVDFSPSDRKKAEAAMRAIEARLLGPQ